MGAPGTGRRADPTPDDPLAWIERAAWTETPRAADLCVGIPTYRRGGPLLESLRSLLAGTLLPDEVLVVDQTEAHEPEIARALGHLAELGAIRWIHHNPPGSCGARNRILLEACCPLVLFLDDDVTCGPELVRAHLRPYADPAVVGVFGRVREPRFPGPRRTHHFRVTWSGRFLTDYDHPWPCATRAGPGGNLSVRRGAALQAGGFDERLVRSGQNEDCDFAFRLGREGVLRYEPQAELVHHVAPRGGGRGAGDGIEGRLRDHFHNDAYVFLRHASPLRLPLYLARQGVTTARIAQGRYERVFPGYRPGLRTWPALLLGFARGFGAALGSCLAARRTEGLLGPRRGSIPPHAGAGSQGRA